MRTSALGHKQPFVDNRIVASERPLSGVKRSFETTDSCATDIELDRRAAQSTGSALAVRPAARIVDLVSTYEKAPHGGGARSLIIWCRHHKSAGQPIWTAERPERSEGEGHGRPESTVVRNLASL